MVVRNQREREKEIVSVQFGRWNFEGQPPAPGYMGKVSALLGAFGPDSSERYSKDNVDILYHALRTTKESHRETQPHISSSGAVMTWDGRLDNRPELIGEFRNALTIDSTDLDIVASAYEKWGVGCFSKLIGDWALSIWNPVNRSLILAKDPIGTRHLYYSFDINQITWSTILDPLVLLAGKTFEICEEYIAGWLSTMFPATHLTPYVGILAVSPSSFVLLRPGSHTVNKYWDFNPGKKIRYRTDSEYEEHFRTVFATAVERRLRSDRPVLAELSGGMDSSSIVCMADVVIARGAADAPRLDTISWFDDSYDHLEPDTNELHWVIKVEGKRNRTGHHINLRELKAKEVRSQRPFAFEFEGSGFAATPILNSRVSDFSRLYATYMLSQGHRVSLSGVGGEEPTGGGVPIPTPEFQNLLARARFFTLAHQLNAWAAKMRKTRLPLLWEAVRGFFPGLGVSNAAPWFNPGFARRNHAALCGYPSRVRLFGPLPSFQDNIGRLDFIRRLLAYCSLRSDLLCERRYPYLDRTMLEFAYAIPREQLVRVGQRRSLMKRALVGIVPDELLKRRQKASIPQEPPANGAMMEWRRLLGIAHHAVTVSLGITDPNRLSGELQNAQHNEEIPIESLMRTLVLEFWLRDLTTRRVLTNVMPAKSETYSSSLAAEGLRVPARHKSSAS